MLHAGTHGVKSVTFEKLGGRREVNAMVDYFDNSTASGALLSFVIVTGSGEVDFSKSFLLALDRNASHNHTLPYGGGHYKVYVYDIERNEILSNGVGYPACAKEVITGKYDVQK